MSGLKSLRDEIDTIDDQIFDLLVKRFNVAKQISVIKAETGAPALDSERWQAVEQRVRTSAQDAGLDIEGTAKIYRAIHNYVLNNIHRS